MKAGQPALPQPRKPRQKKAARREAWEPAPPQGRKSIDKLRKEEAEMDALMEDWCVEIGGDIEKVFRRGEKLKWWQDRLKGTDFVAWCKKWRRISIGTIYNQINAFKLIAQFPIIGNADIDITTLYRLSYGPKRTPWKVKEELIAEMQAGKKLTANEINKRIDDALRAEKVERWNEAHEPPTGDDLAAMRKRDAAEQRRLEPKMARVREILRAQFPDGAGLPELAELLRDPWIQRNLSKNVEALILEIRWGVRTPILGDPDYPDDGPDALNEEPDDGEGDDPAIEEPDEPDEVAAMREYVTAEEPDEPSGVIARGERPLAMAADPEEQQEPLGDAGEENDGGQVLKLAHAMATRQRSQIEALSQRRAEKEGDAGG